MSYPTAAEQEFWGSFCRALGTEPRDHRIIRGISGLDHSVQAIGVDDPGRRVIVVSAEHNPRVVALMQVDIPATVPETRVLVARPISVNLSHMARMLVAFASGNIVGLTQIEAFVQHAAKTQQETGTGPLEEVLGKIVLAVKNAALPVLPSLVEMLQQFALIDWASIEEHSSIDPKNPRFPLDPLLNFDGIANDRKHGVCAIPLYEFQAGEWEQFLSGRVDDARHILTRLSVHQYLYPPADQLALGFVDRGVRSAREVVSAVETAPDAGYPLSANELVPPAKLPELLEALKTEGYVAEGEFGIELSEAGQTIRSTIKYRPREGLLQKLLNRITVNASISPKDFM